MVSQIGRPKASLASCSRRSGSPFPPPTGVKSPAVWGTRSFLKSTFGAAASAITTKPQHFVFRYRSAEHFLDIFRTYYGPVLKAFEALDGRGQKKLTDDIHELIGRVNTSGDHTMVVPSEYLEVIIVRR